jgi:glycosyltransferase involved in cell wall biosynthesis
VTVTVAVPYYGVPDLIERAVRSILAQTHRDLRLIVVGDGQEPPLSQIHDSRLMVYTLPENRGTYFALQLILQASPDEWHAPHGADDWTDPTHLESLLALGKDAVAMGTVWAHSPAPVLSSIGKEGWHVGIFSSQRLKALGGYDPSGRLSQDTMVLKLLDATGGYHRHKSSNPTYHLWKHPGSLTAAPKTSLKSSARNRARAYNNAILSRCRRLKSIDRIRAFRESKVPPIIQQALNEHVGRLRERL